MSTEKRMRNRTGAAGCIAAFLAVALGAFGAHALRDHLEPRLLAIYQTAVQYQFYHAMALVVFAVSGVRSRVVPLLFGLGIFLFSGSLYALALTGVRALGAITPLGGVAWLVAWILWAIAFGRGETSGKRA